MDSALKAKWVEALRSGKYVQAKGCLRDSRPHGDGFCCLGVLCDVIDPEGWDDSGLFRLAHCFPPKEVMTEIGYPDEAEKQNSKFWTAAHMNDEGKSFDEIASYIEDAL